ncbi:hypothetical protein D3C85_1356140 [compost metagenome]
MPAWTISSTSSTARVESTHSTLIGARLRSASCWLTCWINGPAALALVKATVRPDNCSTWLKLRSPLRPTSSSGTWSSTGALLLTPCTTAGSNSSPGAARSPSPRAKAPSSCSLARGISLSWISWPSTARALR